MVFLDNSKTINPLQIKDNSIEDGVVLLIDKNLKWTSFDVVAKLRNLFQIKKIGHAGTLDPLATGLLIVCLGRKATKNIEDFQNLRKKYKATVKFGAVTDTYDSEGEEKEIKDTSNLSIDDIKEVTKNFIGEINQLPPKYSAKKVNGKSAYKLARKNIDFELKPKMVTIYDIKILSYDNPFLEIEVECSKGTYIRSLANDIGSELGVGAYLSALRRTAIGEYNVENAYRIDDIIEQEKNESS